MTHRDGFSFPLVLAAISTPSWIQTLQSFWTLLLPALGGVLLVLQIAYYWKMLRGK